MRRTPLAVVLGVAGLLGCSANPDSGAPESAHVGRTNQGFVIRWPPPPPPTVLYSCTDITKPGVYALGAAVAAPSGQPCMQIHSQGPVTLDCRDFEIMTAWPGQVPLLIQNSQNFTVQNCFIGSSGEFNSPIVQIQSSSSGTLTNNSFARSPVATDDNTLAVVSSSSLTFTDNTFDVPLSEKWTTHSYIANNSFWCAPTSCASMITSNLGSSNVIAYNTMNGNATHDQMTESSGTDDGIIIGDEVNDQVVGNNISNLYDCGIETVGNVGASTFSNNTITNATTCGIGGWYWMSFYDNTVQGNTVIGSANLFTFFRVNGLRPYNFDGHGHAADTGVSFTGNTFTGNSITNNYPTGYFSLEDGYSTFIPFNLEGEYMAFTGTVEPWETAPTSSQFYLTGNAFANNSFGSSAAYFGEPAYPGAVIDQGNNVCVSNGYSDYPLACGGP